MFIKYLTEINSYIGRRQSAEVFARLYKQHALKGGHIIKVGPGNDEAAMEALSAWPGSSSLSIFSDFQFIGLNKTAQIAFK